MECPTGYTGIAMDGNRVKGLLSTGDIVDVTQEIGDGISVEGADQLVGGCGSGNVKGESFGKAARRTVLGRIFK